ncbi:MAG: Peroxiredoxin [Planctomycetota bacterium]|nr:Peroxiredoxin [Planctomycetota bacterium]
MVRHVAALVIITATGASLFAASPKDDRPLSRQVGTRVGDFALKDSATGREVSLYSFQGKKAAVLVFLGTECPIGNLYLPRLAELAKSFEGKGVVFLGINSNSHETPTTVAAHAKEFGIPFPILKDVDAKVADQYQVERTCEVILLDDHATVRYRGAIDDQYGYGTRRPKVTRSYLNEALDTLLAGKTLETTGTSVAGCPIERGDQKTTSLNIPKVRAAAPAILEALKDEPQVEVGPVTYASDVASILQNKCQSCHRPKAAAPFSLLTYDDARRWSASIKEVVDDRRMPPWHADPRFGHFENDRRLSPKDRATLMAWVNQGTPLGDPKALPAPKSFAEGWVVGTPDVILEMPTEYTVQAEGFLNYQYFRIPTKFTEDRWVQSVECLPGDRSVVHHIVALLDDKEPNRGRQEPKHLGGYAPGELPCVYPPGIGKKIPAGSDIFLQVHYTPNGKVRTDRSRVGLIFSKAEPTHQAITKGVANNRFQIGPGQDNVEVKSRFTFGEDSHLLSFMPHMHLRGKDFKYIVTYPGREPEVLLSVPAYDFAWQSYYRLSKPLAMPKGTVIDCIAHFDNSENNPANPDPKATVRWGDQTFEEMMIGYIDYYRDEPLGGKAPGAKAADARPPAGDRPGRTGRAAVQGVATAGIGASR